MLEAAVKDQPMLSVDTRELSREGTSWTVETLRELRGEYPRRALVLLLGMDAFLGLASWRDWEQLADLAHIAVARRPGVELNTTAPLNDWLVARQTSVAGDLHSTPARRVLVHDVTQLEISSSAIRECLAAGRGIDFLVPAPVRDIIVATGCYAPMLAKERSTHAQ